MIRVVVYGTTDEECPEAFRFVANLIGPGTGAKGKTVTEMLPMRFSAANAADARQHAEEWLAIERARQDKLGRDPTARRKSKATAEEEQPDA